MTQRATIVYAVALSFRVSIWWLWINWNIQMEKKTLKWKKHHCKRESENIQYNKLNNI